MSGRGRFQRGGSGRGRGRGGPGGHGGPPPHLKGREIGMWYAKRSKEQSKQEEERLEPDISLSEERISDIRLLMNESVFLKDEDQDQAFHKFNSREFLLEFKRVTDVNIEEQIQRKMKVRSEFDDYFREGDPSEISDLDEKLRDDLAEFVERDSGLQKFRRKLPCWKSRDLIVETISKNQVVLIKGETGCGKTTQVTQFILDDAILRGRGSKTRIICTQPRRISATSVAERVAAERSESLGKSVGYSIRLDTISPRSEGGTILYCTTGVLLKLLETDPTLLDFSHIILDEVHERDTNSDLCIGILKIIARHRKDLRIVLMSATLKAQIFADYFDNCPTVEIEGFTFPVEEKYLEDILQELNFTFEEESFRPFSRGRRQREQEAVTNDLYKIFDPFMKELRATYPPSVIQSLLNPESEKLSFDLLEELIFHISYQMPPGAILVFLPGYQQISRLCQQLEKSRRFPSRQFLVLPLHSLMHGPDQKRVFQRPPEGVRKIICSTNIAETSVTIDDVVYVINAGRRKLTTYDPENNIAVLEELWVSQANATQRRGRAGRCQPGVCFHLYSRARHETLDTDIVPEILRIRLEQVILTLKILGFQNVQQFIQSLITIPDTLVVTRSVSLLQRLSALTPEEKLTPLGYHLAKLPVDPQSGKMILLGSLFCCMDPISSVAASLSFRDAFYSVLGKEREVDAIKYRFSRSSQSDHLMLANVFEEWVRARDRKQFSFCRDNFLNAGTLTQLENMKKQFNDLLKDAKFIGNEADANSRNSRLVRAIICAALYPNLAKICRVRTFKNHTGAKVSIRTKEEGGRVEIFPGSVLGQERSFDSNYLVYFHKQKSTKVYIHDCSTVNPYAILFWGDMIVDGPEFIGVADFLKFRCNEETKRLIRNLREQWDLLLQTKVSSPSPIQWDSSEGKLMEAIIKLITTDRRTVYEDTDDED